MNPVKTWEISIHGRHDPVIVPRAVVVVESMTAVTLADLLLQNMGARMDHLRKIVSAVRLILYGKHPRPMNSLSREFVGTFSFPIPTK